MVERPLFYVEGQFGALGAALLCHPCATRAERSGYDVAWAPVPLDVDDPESHYCECCD